MESAAPDQPELLLRRLLSFNPQDLAPYTSEDFIIDAPGVEDIAARCSGVVLAQANAAEDRAIQLLVAGAPLVFIGDAALQDSALVKRLAARYPERVGIYAPARRQSVSWSFDTVSNADFKVMTPSLAEPAWEVLKADGTPTGTLLTWWLTELRQLGAVQFLVHAEVRDDTDLNILAGLVEMLGESLWVAPRSPECLPLADWINYGRCRQLALSAIDAEHLRIT